MTPLYDHDDEIALCHVNLVEAIVMSSLRPGLYSPVKANLKFADSLLLKHYCDVIGKDYEQLRKAIIIVNKRYKPKTVRKPVETWLESYLRKSKELEQNGKATMGNTKAKTK